MTTNDSEFSGPLPADALLALLLELDANGDDFIVIKDGGNPDQYIQLIRMDEGILRLEHTDCGRHGLKFALVAQDLAVHQAILGWLDTREGWDSKLTWAPVGKVGAAGPVVSASISRQIDYSSTGLSIQFSFLVDSRERKRIGQRGELPPRIIWGKWRIQTGDILGGIPEVGRLLIEVAEIRQPGDHGIAIQSPDGFLDVQDLGGPEVTLWPRPGRMSFEVEYQAPHRVIRIANVYKSVRSGRLVVGRWTENSALFVEERSVTHRVYHCNFHSTTPPSFQDLVFSIRALPAPELGT